MEFKIKTEWHPVKRVVDALVNPVDKFLPAIAQELVDDAVQIARGVNVGFSERLGRPYRAWVTGGGGNIGTLTYKAQAGNQPLEIFTTSGYGAYLELGTRNRPATPAVLPAMEALPQRLPEIVKRLRLFGGGPAT